MDLRSSDSRKRNVTVSISYKNVCLCGRNTSRFKLFVRDVRALETITRITHEFSIFGERERALSCIALRALIEILLLKRTSTVSNHSSHLKDSRTPMLEHSYEGTGPEIEFAYFDRAVYGQKVTIYALQCSGHCSMRADILLGPDIGLQTNSPSLKLEIEVSEELITSPSPDDLITNGLTGGQHGRRFATGIKSVGCLCSLLPLHKPRSPDHAGC